MKRNLINEIRESKGRHPHRDRHDYTSKLDEIELIIAELQNYNGSVRGNMLKYIPISTVACFQSFFRSVVKEMVDFRKPFSDNVANFNQSQNVKLDFQMLAAIREKTLTLGEFISHILPYNNLNDINTNLSVLMDGKFLQELKSFSKASIFEQVVEVGKKFREQADAVMCSINRTYQLRHIFCHEFAANIKNNSRKPPLKSPALKHINGGFWLLSVDRHLAGSLSPYHRGLVAMQCFCISVCR